MKIRNNFRSTPLHAAAQRKHDHIVELLLANQVDIYTRDSKGKLAIEYSVASKDYKSANLMMDQFISTLQPYEKNSENPKWLWILRQSCVDNQFQLAQKIVKFCEIFVKFFRSRINL